MIKSEKNNNLIFKNLNKLKKKINSRYINKSESSFLIEKLCPKKLTKFLIKLMLNSPIVGQYFSLSCKEDKSGLGVERYWSSPKFIVEDILMRKPGKIVHKHEYIAIGFCAKGSGDPYCITSTEKKSYY